MTYPSSPNAPAPFPPTICCRTNAGFSTCSRIWCTRARQNRAYLGVGPEQNFTYIVALKPKMAFIVDIRRGNFDIQLIYKALFEMSTDRADFVSRLFSRPRPDGLTAKSTAEEIFTAVANVQATDTLYSRNMRAIVNQLTKVHQFQLSSADILRMQHIYNAIYVYGPGIQYSTTTNAGRRITKEPTYAELMKEADEGGFEHSFLATEDAFAYMKTVRNRESPDPGDGRRRGTEGAAIGRPKYLSEQGAVISAFYISNVEEYLKPGRPSRRRSAPTRRRCRSTRRAPSFARNAAARPISASSWISN